MKITADELYALLRRAPDNKLSGGVAMIRSGRRVELCSALDIEALASKLNEHFGAKA